MATFYILEFEDCVQYEAYWTTALPVQFDGSKEELKFEFELKVEDAIKNSEYEFDFNNLKSLDVRCFTTDHFDTLHKRFVKIYNNPRFYTFEEWCRVKNTDLYPVKNSDERLKISIGDKFEMSISVPKKEQWTDAEVADVLKEVVRMLEAPTEPDPEIF